VADENRRFKAVNIRFTNERVVATSLRKDRKIDTVFAILFCSILVFEVILGRLPFAILGAYFVASILAFVAYAEDKAAAQNNRWRVKESSLHFLGVVGGWPGALLAQKKYRHKSKKEEFQTVFWATVFINCFAVGWLLTNNGAIFLNGLLGIIGQTS
jgi:uncharacterized membrane protein YsdA (DUF1294 family)